MSCLPSFVIRRGTLLSAPDRLFIANVIAIERFLITLLLHSRLYIVHKPLKYVYQYFALLVHITMYKQMSKVIAKSATFLILFHKEDGRKRVKYLCNQNPEFLNLPEQEVFDTFAPNLGKYE